MSSLDADVFPFVAKLSLGNKKNYGLKPIRPSIIHVLAEKYCFFMKFKMHFQSQQSQY